jgi:DNA-binding transcriptional regulator YiaG
VLKFTPEQIREIRGSNSQVAFARSLGCTIVALSRWENGHAEPGRWFTHKLKRRVAKSNTAQKGAPCPTE